MQSTEKQSNAIDQANQRYDAACRHIGLIIRRFRETKKISQSDLARRASCHLSYVCSVENGISNLSIRKLTHICNAMGVSSEKVMCLIDLKVCCAEAEKQAGQLWTNHFLDVASALLDSAGAYDARLRVADTPSDPPAEMIDRG